MYSYGYGFPQQQKSSSESPLGAINYQELYKSMKMVHSLESRRIKKLLFYNYVNDSIESIIVDTRNNNTILPSIPNSARLIIILNDNEDLKTSPRLESLRQSLKTNESISGLFHIFTSDFNDVMKTYPFLLMKGLIKLPLCVLNDIFYVGGFINSKNKQTISYLNIKTMISLMRDPDKELTMTFGDNYRNFQHEESKHDEIEFSEISDFFFEQINHGKFPILLYCFSGNTSCLAAAVIIVMKYKKWPLDLSIGYVLKLSPTIEMPTWLYTQLQRFVENEKINKFKEMNNMQKSVFSSYNSYY